MTLAALEAVLALYRKPEFLANRLTTLRLLTQPIAAMQAQSCRLLPVVQGNIADVYLVATAPMFSQIGSGALPVDQLPSHGLVVRCVKGRRGSLQRLDEALRALPRLVIGRIAEKAVARPALPREPDGRNSWLSGAHCVHDRRHGRTHRPRQDLAGAPLTGVDTDRLKEEKVRVHFDRTRLRLRALANGDVLGFVDVPGHERLVRTMVAGACGIDFALLVVAADDGVMPQTREHLAILELLGITRGAVALSKVDRVDGQRVEQVRAELAAELASTALRDAPVFALNAIAPDDPGTEALRRHLHDTAASIPSRPDQKLFRLAVDRVFTLTGHGVVTTGTVFRDDPHGRHAGRHARRCSARVRGIHAQKPAVGQRECRPALCDQRRRRGQGLDLARRLARGSPPVRPDDAHRRPAAPAA
jgi:signal recognition particle receptor subunit beta